MTRRGHARSPVVSAVAWIVAVAALATGGLWWLHRLYTRSLHDSATATVIELGALVAGQLAGHPALNEPQVSAGSWQEFARVAQSVRRVEPGLQYVSVAEEGVLLFQKQLEGGPEVTGEIAIPAGAVGIGRSLLHVGNETIPVITFTIPVRGLSGGVRSLQVGVRKDAVDRREAEVTAGLRRMFRAANLTLLASFGVSVAVVCWLLSREMRRQQQQRAEEHLAFAGALSDGLIHDFRNPLSSLKLDVQLLQRETAKGDAGRRERIGELSARVGRTIDRVDGMFREFLYVARPDGAEKEPVAAREGLKDCLDLLAPRLERLGVKMSAQLPAEPVVVRAYPSGLKRALINLLINAEQASPQGGTVTAGLRAEGGRAVIEVLDEGPGLPKGAAHRVFDMFFTTRPGGTGLGLSLARTAVENSGGAIEASNRPEGGARFAVYLPLADAAGAEAAAARAG